MQLVVEYDILPMLEEYWFDEPAKIQKWQNVLRGYSMTNDKGILIKNIYYMLTYAFQTLRRSDFDTVAAEKFENIHDLFAAILGKGVAYQLKQGLYKEYILQTEERTALRGKLNLQETMKNRIRQRQSCSVSMMNSRKITCLIRV